MSPTPRVDSSLTGHESRAFNPYGISRAEVHDTRVGTGASAHLTRHLRAAVDVSAKWLSRRPNFAESAFVLSSLFLRALTILRPPRQQTNAGAPRAEVHRSPRHGRHRSPTRPSGNDTTVAFVENFQARVIRSSCLNEQPVVHVGIPPRLRLPRPVGLHPTLTSPFRARTRGRCITWLTTPVDL